MPVTTRTNRATNPNVGAAATGWGHVAGTGGAAASGRNTGLGYDSEAGFFRATWNTASTAAGGGLTYTQTGLSASTQYTHSLYVRPSTTLSFRLQAQYQNSSSVNVGGVTNGTTVSCPANEWTRISVTATSGAGVDRVVLTAAAQAAIPLATNIDGDCVLIETGSVLGQFFDGGYAAGLGHVYAWTSTADGSTSTDVLYDPALALLVKLDDPCARVEITISDLAPTIHRVTLWRTADGRRRKVRSYENVEVVGSDFTTDYEPPLNRTITYEIEVLSGTGMGGPDGSGTCTVTPTDGCGYIQDPLDPSTAIKVYATAGPNGEPTLHSEALAQLEYGMDVELAAILGADEPVALMGQRMAAQNVPFDMFTDAAQQSTNLRNMLRTVSMVLIRPGVDWGNSLPGLCYIAPPTPKEIPVGVVFGSAYTEWKFTASLAAAPTMNVVIPTWTYQDWAALWTTYQSAQTALAGKSYLAVRRSPANGV